jgi:GDP-4-dehydro-6-deoxy-D-mannose reductase
MMRAFVTGADGFAGQWLVRALVDAGCAVTGFIRASAPLLTTLDERRARSVTWSAGDIADGHTVAEAVRSAAPDAVYHLAAQAFVPASQDDPLATLRTNFMGTVNVLEAVRTTAAAATVLVVGSADAYGVVGEDLLPVRESQPLAPRNPYAASKAAAELVAMQYARAGCSVIATRSFNHAGPGQRPSFAVASFARQIAEIKAGRRPAQLDVGDLSPRRDYTDVRDVAGAYMALVASGAPGTAYNVCSGESRSMADILNDLLRLAGVEAEIRRQPERLRTADIPVSIGDPSLIRRQTGWRQRIPFERTLADMLEYYAHALA